MLNFLSNLARRGAGVPTEYTPRTALFPIVAPGVLLPTHDLEADSVTDNFRLGNVSSEVHIAESAEETIDRPTQNPFHPKVADATWVDETELPRAEQSSLPQIGRSDFTPRRAQSVGRDRALDDCASPLNDGQSAAPLLATDLGAAALRERSRSHEIESPLILNAAPAQQAPHRRESTVLAPPHGASTAEIRATAAPSKIEPETLPTGKPSIPHAKPTWADHRPPYVSVLPQATAAGVARVPNDRGQESQPIQVKIGKVEIRANQPVPSPCTAVPKYSTGFQDFALRRAHLDRNYR